MLGDSRLSWLLLFAVPSQVVTTNVILDETGDPVLDETGAQVLDET